MEEQQTTCSCGNIAIHGRCLEHGYLPNIPGGERVCVADYAFFFIIKGKSITIEDRSAVTLHQRTPICTDIICRKCSSTFQLFLSRPCSLIGRVQQSTRARSPQSLHRIPVSKAALDLITFESHRPQLPSDPDDIADTEFDLMFGNRRNPFVGSCRSPLALRSPGSIPRNRFV